MTGILNPSIRPGRRSDERSGFVQWAGFFIRHLPGRYSCLSGFHGLTQAQPITFRSYKSIIMVRYSQAFTGPDVRQIRNPGQARFYGIKLAIQMVSATG